MEISKKSFKTVFIGDSSVGKTSIVTRLCKNIFNENNHSTIGASFMTYDLTYKTESGANKVRFEFWDTAGQERYNSITPLYLRGAHLVLIVFDLTDRKSFETIKTKWIRMCLNNLDNNYICCLLGNKSDLYNRCIKNKEVENYIKECNFNFNNDIYYYETSAKTGENIKKCFEDLAVALVTQLPEEKNYPEINKKLIINDEPFKNNYKCCKY